MTESETTSTRTAVSAFVPTPDPSDRRTLLRRAGLVALIGGGAVGLAACGGSDTSGTPAAGPTSAEASAPASSAAASPSASQSSSASSGSSSSAAAPTGYQVPAADVPEGGGVISGDYVVTQPTAGEYKAFSKICTHQQCPVSKVADGKILCPCHGSSFSITDGSVQGGPANKPLASATVQESGSSLYIS